MREDAGGESVHTKVFFVLFWANKRTEWGFPGIFFSLLLETSGILPFSFSDQRMRQEILLSGKNPNKVK